MALATRQTRGDRRVQGTRDLLAVDARDERLPDVRLLQSHVALRTELDVNVLPGVADLLVNDELLVLEEVGDLELRLRLHDLTLTGLQRLESGVRVEDVAEHDAVELHLRPGRELRVPFTASWTPFCQLSNRHGPLDTAIEFRNIWFMSWPAMTCAGIETAREEGLPVGVRLLEDDGALLPLAVMDLTSSQPVRLMTLFFGLMKTCQVALRSLAVTGLPSDQFASFCTRGKPSAGSSW